MTCVLGGIKGQDFWPEQQEGWVAWPFIDRVRLNRVGLEGKENVSLLNTVTPYV